MDGFEATRQIREAEKATGRHTPIAAMTAHSMVGDSDRCIAAGMDYYISKPVSQGELGALLDRVSLIAGGLAFEPTAPANQDFVIDKRSAQSSG
jgi:CheY-like chemotaxis protein